MSDAPIPASEEAGPRRTLTTAKIAFFVIAATAPMAAMVGTVPYGFAPRRPAGEDRVQPRDRDPGRTLRVLKPSKAGVWCFATSWLCWSASCVVSE
jgi:hypothetical protein